MDKVDKMETIKNYNDYLGVETYHPLISVVNFDEISEVQSFRRLMSVYAVFLKDIKCGNMIYGCQPYDYEDGTLVFVAPGQVYGIDSKGVVSKPTGYALVFHPDLIKGTQLAKTIKDYSFFSYHVNEALHVSKKERKSLWNVLKKLHSKFNKI